MSRLSCAPPWVLRNEGTRSILDLLEGTMVLLVGRNGLEWPAPPSGLRLRNQADFISPSSKLFWEFGRVGAVLVRPDGYVGARQTIPEDPEGALHEALYTILSK